MTDEERAERHRQRIKEQTRKRKAAGICTRCGKLPAEEGHTLCPACRLINNNYSKKLYAKRSSTQKCTKCGKRQRVKESNLCRTCSNKRKESQKAIRDRHRANFECMQCGKPLEASERGRVTRCFDCREKNARYKAERADNRRTKEDYKKRSAEYPQNMELYLYDLASALAKSNDDLKKRKQTSTKSKSAKPTTAVNAVLDVAAPTIETIPKKCPVCGKVFRAPRFSNQKYCSRSCRYEAMTEYRKKWPSAQKNYKTDNRTASEVQPQQVRPLDSQSVPPPAILNALRTGRALKVKICPICKKEFEYTGFAKFCIDCRAAARKMTRKQWEEANADYYADRKSTRTKAYSSASRPTVTQPPQSVVVPPPIQRGLKSIDELETSTMTIGGQEVTVYHCHKMQLKAMNLPCGKREECYLNPRCPFIPERASVPRPDFNFHLV